MPVIGRVALVGQGANVGFSYSIQASDRFNINSQLEHLQAKYVGTGHADLNRLLVFFSF